jgi:hypothetical protein
MHPGLLSVELVGDHVFDISNRFAHPLRNLERLTMRVELRRLQNLALHRMPKLRYLDLSQNRLLPDIGFATLPARGTLEYLNVQNFSFRNAPVYTRPYGLSSALSPSCGQASPPSLLTNAGDVRCQAKTALSVDNKTCWRFSCPSPGWTVPLASCPGQSACGESVPETHLCDGFADCTDGSDEGPAFCSWELTYIE